MKKVFVILAITPLLSGCFSYMATKAVSKGDFPKVKHYVEDKNVRPDRLMPTAITQCRTNEVAYLLEKGASAKVRWMWTNKEIWQSMGFRVNRLFSPLITAIENKCPGIVEMLLARGAEVNAPLNERGLGPMFMAAKMNSPQVIDLLVKNGGDVNKQASENITPLLIAVEFSNIEAVNKLLEHGANTEVAYERLTPLVTAVVKGNLSVVTALIDKKANVNAVYYGAEYGSSNGKKFKLDVPLVKFAFDAGRSEIFDALLRAGANIDSVDSDGNSALSKVILENANVSKVKQLLSRGANPNSKCPGDKLVLHAAINNGNYDVVEALLNAGANPETVHPNYWKQSGRIPELIASRVREKYKKAAKLIPFTGGKISVNARKYKSGDYMCLDVGVENTSSGIISVDPSMLMVANEDGSVLPAVSPEVLLKAMYPQQNYQSIQYVAQAPASVAPITIPAPTTYNVRGSSNKIGNTVYSNYTATQQAPHPYTSIANAFANGMAQAEAQRQADRSVAAVQEAAMLSQAMQLSKEQEAKETARAVTESLFVPAQIPPGASYNASIYFSRPKGSQIRVYLVEKPATYETIPVSEQ